MFSVSSRYINYKSKLSIEQQYFERSSVVFNIYVPFYFAAAEEYSGLQAQTSAQQQTARLIELVLTKGNAAAEVFRNWIQKNDVHLLRDLMGTSSTLPLLLKFSYWSVTY